MANEVAKVEEQPKAVTIIESDNCWLDTAKFNQIQRAAKVLASSALVPAHFRGQDKVGDCVIALQMANRMDVDPFMLMQRLYVVHGKPGLEAQLVIALVNKRGPFNGPIQWRFSGEEGKDTWTATAFATMDNGQICEAECSIALAKAEGWYNKEGSKWKTMPKQMLRYRSATFLARLYCPEVLMGMSTIDEVYDAPEPIKAEAIVVHPNPNDFMPLAPPVIAKPEMREPGEDDIEDIGDAK